MPLSEKKQKKLELKARQELINNRSLDGKGYFMDTNAEIDARKYLETGDEKYLEYLPDYSYRRR